MNRPRTSLRHTLFGAALTGCLLFGATQAFARPPGYVSIEVSCDVNNPSEDQRCKEACAAQPEQYVDGRCWGSGDCICQVW